MLRIVIAFICLSSIAALQTGCFSSGAKISTTGFESLVEGRSTPAEVERAMGKPSAKTTAEGRTIYRYEREEVRMYQGGYGSVGFNQDSAEFLFNDSNGILIKKHRSQGKSTMSTVGIGKYASATPLTEAAIKEIRPGETYAKISELLGQPFSEELQFNGALIRKWLRMEANIKKDVTRHLVVWFDMEDRVELIQVIEE